LNIGAAEQALRTSQAQTETNRKLVEAAARQAEGTVVAAKTPQDSLTANQRAWVGPTDATIVPPEAFKPLKATITYGNSERQLAPIFSNVVPKIYTVEDWIGGVAAADIEKFKADCLELPMNDQNARITFPTTGFNSFVIHHDGTQQNRRDVGRLSVTPEHVSGTAVVAFKGSFVYRTIEQVHRTTFYYFYQAKVSDTHPGTSLDKGAELDAVAAARGDPWQQRPKGGADRPAALRVDQAGKMPAWGAGFDT
jgi:hypothetical protein